MVAQFRDRETDHGQSRDGPNPENARNNATVMLLFTLTAIYVKLPV